jgi:uncharacterized membrane protein
MNAGHHHPTTHAQAAFSTERAGARLAVRDLTGDLVWPLLLRTPGLALRPDRIGLGALALLIVSLAIRLSDAWAPDPDLPTFAETAKAQIVPALSAVRDGLARGSSGAAADGLFALLVAGPARVAVDFPFSTVILAAALVVALPVIGGSIARAVAVEVATGVLLPWSASFAMGMSRLRSLVMAPAGMLAGLTGVLGLLALGGWLLLSFPVLNLVGGALYGLALLLGAFALVLIFGLVVASPLMPPAVACDDADAIDAAQRALAYVLARPIRAGLYWLLLVIQCAFVLFVTALLASILETLTASTAGSMTRAGADVIAGPAGMEGFAWHQRSAAWLVEIWTALPWVLVGGYALSLHFTGSTLLYLVLRRLSDGQDPGDIWMPGRHGAFEPAGAAPEDHHA